ncbi:MAG: IS66 family transposase [Butyrivibrio sp.]|nr:IS66 family transposase [Butyrivibrio sp.]
MKADRKNFEKTINGLGEYYLRELCMSMYDMIEEKTLRENASDRINTESALAFRAMQKELEDTKKELEDCKKVIAKLNEQLSLKTRMIFGRHTEKFIDSLENAQNPPEEFEDESQVEDSDERGKKKGSLISFEDLKKSRSEDPGKDGQNNSGNNGSHVTKDNGSKKGTRTANLYESIMNLPMQLLYDLDIDKLNEEYGEGNWRIARWHEHFTIEKIECPIYVKRILTPVISSGLEHRMSTVPYKNPIKDRSYLSASLLADILYRKFVLALPFYRQSDDYNNWGLALSRQVIIRWVNELVPVITRPVIEYLTELMLQCRYHQCDETYLLVNRDGRAAGTKGFLWVHSTSELASCNPIILFFYEATRGTDHLRKLLLEFHGYITCDAYISYHVMEEESEGRILATGCLMHCRRYFAIALFVNDLKGLTDEQILEMPEVKVLMLIREVYEEENRLKNMTADDRLLARKEFVAPKMGSLFEYIHELAESEIVFSEKLAKAIDYAINQEIYLRRFLEDGNIPCDNGSSERHIRGYSVGRANWLFADTITGAEVNAAMYSIVETAKANNVNPYTYIKYLIEKIPEHLDEYGNITDHECLKDMVPWSDAFHTYEEECAENRNRMYSGMFPAPVIPKPPRKTAEAASEDPAADTA